MTENVVPRRQYTNEFKVEAVRLAESVGQHEAARRLGVPVVSTSDVISPEGVRLESWTGLCRESEALPVFERAQ